MDIYQIKRELQFGRAFNLDEKLPIEDLIFILEHPNRNAAQNLTRHLMAFESDVIAKQKLESHLKYHPENWDFLVESLNLSKMKSVRWANGKFEVPEGMEIKVGAKTEALLKNAELMEGQDFVIDNVKLLKNSLTVYAENGAETGEEASNTEKIMAALFPKVPNKALKVAYALAFGSTIASGSAVIVVHFLHQLQLHGVISPDQDLRNYAISGAVALTSFLSINMSSLLEKDEDKKKSKK